MYDLVGKLLNGIKCMYVNNLAVVRIKEGESEWCKRRLCHVPLAL